MALFSTFQTAVDALTHSPKQILLAYSGGLDSHVLLHLLARYKEQHPQHQYLAVHVHHGLSPHADDWLIHCEHTAKTLGIDFKAEKVSLSVSNRESLEAEARLVRYQAISKYLTADSVLLLGQHLDDQLETFLLQLKRGAGVKGLSAMAANMPFELVAGCEVSRPLLTASQDSLNEYANEHELIWVEDESNNDQSYDRNFLRHEVIPVLKQRWPQIAKTVHRSAELCAEQQTLADEIAELDLKKVKSRTDSLQIAGLEKLSQIRRNNVLRYWLSEQGNVMPSRHHLEKVWHEVVNATEDANPQLNWQGGQFRRYQDRLYNVGQFAELKDHVINANALKLALDAPLSSFDMPDGLGQLNATYYAETAMSSPVLEYLPDQSCLKLPDVDQDVTIRFRGQGKCQPAGRHGSRSIKKLYQEYQIAPWLRDRVPLIYYGEELVCAVGLWICEGFQSEVGLKFQLE